LIVAIFIVMAAALFGRAMLIGGPVAARAANQAAAEVRAQRAAEAGAAYARLQIRDNSDWRGDHDTDTIDQEDLKVSERNGNVIGWMRDQQGQVSMFRLRFNYQDGGGGGDDLSDPPADYAINTTYLSLNNVRGGTDATVPDVNPGTYEVDDPDVGALTCPEGSVFLRVEGLAGRGVDNSTGPHELPTQGIVTRRVLRAIYSVSVEPDTPDSALSAGNGIAMEMEQRADIRATGGTSAKLRSKKEVSVKDASGSEVILDFDDVEGSIGRDSGAGGVQALVPAGNSVEENQESVGDGNDFHSVTWDQVPSVSTDPSEAVQMPAGVYISDFSGVYHYYDMPLDQVQAQPVDPSTGVPNGGTALGTDLGTGSSDINVLPPDPGADPPQYAHTLNISKSVNFTETGSGVKDVTFANVSGRELYDGDDGSYSLTGGGSTLALYEITEIKIDNADVSSPGDLNILVDLQGNNTALVSEGDTVIAAPSVRLEVNDSGVSIANLEQRLSVYTKGDLTVSSYLHIPEFFLDLGPYGSTTIPEQKIYGTLDLQGLLYAWGDATVYGGTPGQHPGSTLAGDANYGEILISGALVAYGADPGSGEPGLEEKGRITAYGMSALIDYDSTKLVPDPTALAEEGIPDLLRQSYGFEQ
jgi:hypothetical protein